MKVAVIGFNNLKYSPYIKTYTDLLDKYSVEYDVIIPNRNEIVESINGNLISIKWETKKGKIYNFINFTRETRKILKNENYEFVFVLTTLPAVLLSRVLIKKYKNRYLVDIRDYTYDKKIIFRNCELKVLKNANLRVISSPAFKDFLPSLDYVLCHNFSHNIPRTDIKYVQSLNEIKIAYVGSISYVNECKRLVDLVKNDDRFCFYLYGNEVNGNIVSDYVSKIGTERIKYFGGYDPSEKNSIIQNIDILFNDYGNESDLVRCALSNKLYDSFVFKKPLITSPNTIMSKLASDFSFDIDSNTKNLNDMYDWYMNLNQEEMVSYMNDCLDIFIKDNNNFEEQIRKIIGENI